jgi:ADP-ribose pyrophosphatase
MPISAEIPGELFTKLTHAGKNGMMLEADENLEIVAAAVATRMPPLITPPNIMPTPETLFESRWLGLYRIGRWDFVRRPNSDACVGVLAITPAQEIILVEQFRIPMQRHVIEVPAGLVGDEPEHAGESLAETAGRELLEETGYRAGSMLPLISSPTSAGMSSEFTHLFHATGLVREQQGGGVAGENILVHHIPLSQLREWLAAQEAAGKLVDFKIHAALWLAGIVT